MFWRRWGLLSVVGWVLGGSSGAFAGIVLLPDDALNAAPAFEVRYVVTEAQVDARRAQVKMSETIAPVLADDTGAKPRSFSALFPLPSGVDVSSVKLRLNDADLPGQVLDVEAAQAMLVTLSSARKDARLLTFSGQPLLFVERLSLAKEATFSLEFTSALTDRAGLLLLEVPMPAVNFATGPARRVTLRTSIHADRPVRATFSPTHSTTVRRPSPGTAEISVDAEHLADPRPFQLFFAIDDDPVGLRVLTHRAENDSRGYFMVLGNPTGDPHDVALPKDVILALDTSGSMRGEKMEQALLAAEHVLEHLNPGDRFNLVTFGTEVRSFRQDPVPGDAAQLKAAHAFLDDSVAVGRTNISGALKACLGGARIDRTRIVLFLTDGTPTAGEQNPEKVLGAIAGFNTSGSRVFALGIGHDVNAHLLDQLATKTGGRSVYVGPDEEIDLKVAALYEQLSYPFMDTAKLSFGELSTSDTYPAKLPALFRGQEILLVGRYAGSGRHEIILSGTGMGGRESVAYSVTADFPAKAEPQHEFLAQLWAARRIGTLLHKLRLSQSESKDREALVKELIELSETFGVVTEYTRYLGDGQVMAPDAAMQAVEQTLGTANRQRAGSWAVRQSMNEAALRTRKVQSATANVFLDRKGKVRKAKKLKQVGRRAFYKRDGRWVQSGDAPSAKRRVQRFSPEYFDLIKTKKGFREAQTLEGDMTINFDDVQIEVYK